MELRDAVRLVVRGLLVALVGVLTPCLSSARVIRVPPGRSIQAAVNKARPGDRILLSAGVYTQSVCVHRPVQIVGRGMDATFLDGGGTGPVVIVTTRRPVRLTDLTIRNGRVEGHPGQHACGAGIRNTSARLTLVRVRIADNELYGGPAVTTAAGDARGAGVFSTGPLFAYRCRFERNAAVGGASDLVPGGPNPPPEAGNGYGGGLYVGNCARLIGCVFESNYCQMGRYCYYGRICGEAMGAAVCAESARVFAAECVFNWNTAYPKARWAAGRGWDLGSGGGAFYQVGGLASLKGCRFICNYGALGGGILNSDGQMKLANCRFDGNSARCGGALFNHECAQIKLSESEVLSGNAESGGGIFNLGDLVAVGTTISSNDVGYRPRDGLLVREWDARGGGLANHGRAWLREVHVEENIAHYGGGIFAAGETYMQETTVAENLGVLGAGVWVEPSNGVLQADKCLFIRNHAAGSQSFLYGHGYPQPWPGKGGAILNRGRVDLADCVLSGNEAFGYTLWIYEGGAFGGALFNEGTALVTRCCFVSNSVWGWSGFCGVYLDGGAICNTGVLEVLDCVFAHNEGRSYRPYGIPRLCGGALANWSWARMVGCTLASNALLWLDTYGSFTSLGAAVYSPGIVEMGNTIICDDQNDSVRALWGNVFSLGWNLIEDTSDAVIENTQENDLIGEEAGVGPVIVAGPASAAVLLAPDSPALDQGQGEGTLDVRGLRRPYDLASYPNAADGSDIGAFEMAEYDAFLLLQDIVAEDTNRVRCVLRVWNVGLQDLDRAFVAVLRPGGWSVSGTSGGAVVFSQKGLIVFKVGLIPRGESQDIVLMFEQTSPRLQRDIVQAKVYPLPQDQVFENNYLRFSLASAR